MATIERENQHTCFICKNESNRNNLLILQCCHGTTSQPDVICKNCFNLLNQLNNSCPRCKQIPPLKTIELETHQEYYSTEEKINLEDLRNILTPSQKRTLELIVNNQDPIYFQMFQEISQKYNKNISELLDDIEHYHILEICTIIYYLRRSYNVCFRYSPIIILVITALYILNKININPFY